MSNLKQQYDRASWTILASLLITLIILACQVPAGTTLGHMTSAIRPFFNRLDLLLYDLRFNTSLAYKATSAPKQKIVIVDIDENSLQTVGRWPWSRRTVAELTQKLFDAGAVVVTFDVVFSEAERNIASELKSQLPGTNQQLKSYLGQVESDFNYDQFFANTIAGKDVILGFVLQDRKISANQLPRSNVVSDVANIDSLTALEAKGITSNIPTLQEKALAEGFMNGPPDDDGIVRRTPLVYRYQDKFYGSLALQTVMAYNLSAQAVIRTLPVSDFNLVSGVSIDTINIPTDLHGQALVPYRGGRGFYPYISAEDILSGTFRNSDISGAIVLIGTSAIGLADLRGTPVGIQYPGVESHATMIDAILSGDIPYKPDWANGANVIGMVLIFLLLNAVLPLCGPLAMVAIGSLSAGLVTLTNFWFWHRHGIDLPLAGLLLEVLVIFTFYLAHGFIFSAKQKNQIHSMFGQYVAPAHIDKLISDPSSLHFEGESKEMTVMFSDIRSFTNFSEKLSANQLKELLNSYLTPMTEIIFSQQGTIDKYVGDMIMAFWGAPLDDPDQKLHAVTTALMMIQKTKEMNPGLVERGYPEIHIGIGINTGVMNVGDMGSVYRRAYTVLGDAVNLGSRLESITKFYGVNILVSESTVAGIGDQLLLREVDYIQVKGKSEAIRVFEPLALKEQANPQQTQLVQRYHEARQVFLRKDWQEAKRLFSELCEVDRSSSVLYNVYMERCDLFSTHPPADGWQGVWKHDSK